MRYDKEKRIFMVKKYHELKNYTLVRRALKDTLKSTFDDFLNRLSKLQKNGGSHVRDR